MLLFIIDCFITYAARRHILCSFIIWRKQYFEIVLSQLWRNDGVICYCSNWCILSHILSTIAQDLHNSYVDIALDFFINDVWSKTHNDPAICSIYKSSIVILSGIDFLRFFFSFLCIFDPFYHRRILEIAFRFIEPVFKSQR